AFEGIKIHRNCSTVTPLFFIRCSLMDLNLQKESKVAIYGIASRWSKKMLFRNRKRRDNFEALLGSEQSQSNKTK
ncbi:hypothetical protein CU098_002407, partial [Rhizopus stolonifer]